MNAMKVFLFIGVLFAGTLGKRSSNPNTAQIQSAITQLRTEHIKMYTTGVFDDMKLVAGLNKVMTAFETSLKRIPSEKQSKFKEFMKKVESRIAQMTISESFDSTIFQSFDKFFQEFDN
jgi:DNA anti-recombination protein RmuC